MDPIPDSGETMKLANRSAIITGGNRGFGKVVAQAFVDEGANVLLCARDGDLLEQTRQEIASTAKAGQSVLVQPCDVSNPAQVESLIATALEQLGTVHILVNNAGVYGPMGQIESVNWAEWARAVEINLYGVVLPTRLLLPHLRAQKYGKIITLSGGGATNPMPNISAYAASKAAVVRMMETLAEETRGMGIDINCIAPGALNTRMLDQALEAGPEVVGAKFYQRMVEIKNTGGAPMDKGASLCVYLASDASDGLTGKLISAVWDPWETLSDHAEDLSSDVYTLRRIVPKDRGMNWGDK